MQSLYEKRNRDGDSPTSRTWKLCAYVAIVIVLTIIGASYSAYERGEVDMERHLRKVENVGQKFANAATNKAGLIQAATKNRTHAYTPPDEVEVVRNSTVVDPQESVKYMPWDYSDIPDPKVSLDGVQRWWELEYDYYEAHPVIPAQIQAPKGVSDLGYVILVASNTMLEEQDFTIISVIKQSLREQGSPHDVNVLVYQGFDTDVMESTKLSSTQETALKEMGVRIWYVRWNDLARFYIPLDQREHDVALIDYERIKPQKHEVWNRHQGRREWHHFNEAVQWFKFFMFSLVEYEKLMFIDYDVLPLLHFDDFLEKMPAPLMMQAAGTPTNGGFIVIEPSLEQFTHVFDLIVKRVNRPDTVKFADAWGWGAKLSTIEYDIEYTGLLAGLSLPHSGSSFFAVDYDQGLFTHLCYFDFDECFIAVHNTRFDRIDEGMDSWNCGQRDVAHVKNGRVNIVTEDYPAFFSDFMHFQGASKYKPWKYCSVQKDISERTCTNVAQAYDAWCMLRERAVQYTSGVLGGHVGKYEGLNRNYAELAKTFTVDWLDIKEWRDYSTRNTQSQTT